VTRPLQRERWSTTGRSAAGVRRQVRLNAAHILRRVAPGALGNRQSSAGPGPHSGVDFENVLTGALGQEIARSARSSRNSQRDRGAVPLSERQVSSP